MGLLNKFRNKKKGTHLIMSQQEIGTGRAGGEEITLTATLEYHKPPHRIEADELLKKATALKAKGDWSGAIKCLRKAYAALGDDIVNYSAETSLRLPLFLQQAGRFDEAMQEFNRLLSEVEPRLSKGFNHQTGLVRAMLAHAWYAAIYDKMQLACRRERLPERADEYSDIAESHRQKHARLMKVEQLAREVRIGWRTLKRKVRLARPL